MPAKIVFAEGNITKQNLDIHQPNTLANVGRIRVEDVHCRGDPSCEPVVSILGLVNCGYLLPKDDEDGFRGVTGIEG